MGWRNVYVKAKFGQSITQDDFTTLPDEVMLKRMISMPI
jgi:hypothetical protein